MGRQLACVRLAGALMVHGTISGSMEMGLDGVYSDWLYLMLVFSRCGHSEHAGYVANR